MSRGCERLHSEGLVGCSAAIFPRVESRGECGKTHPNERFGIGPRDRLGRCEPSSRYEQHRASAGSDAELKVRIDFPPARTQLQTRFASLQPSARHSASLEQCDRAGGNRAEMPPSRSASDALRPLPIWRFEPISLQPSSRESHISSIHQQIASPDLTTCGAAGWCVHYDCDRLPGSRF
jgi:hypothetical protein